MGRKVTLGAYTPRLKHELLVDGLAYVRRFAGLRVAVSFKGSVLSSPTLLDAAVRDLELMADAGLRPLGVVPGEEDASHLVTELTQAGARVRRLDPVLGPIAAWLDRGGIAVVPMAPDPGELVARCIKLGVQKLLVLADDQGLRDDEGLVSLLTLEQARVGLHARIGAVEGCHVCILQARCGRPDKHDASLQRLRVGPTEEDVRGGDRRELPGGVVAERVHERAEDLDSPTGLVGEPCA